MRASIVRIGNSRGIRIPKALLDECGIHDVVDLSVQEGHLIVRPARRTREGWSEAARSMVDAGEDGLLDAESPTRFDDAEWEW